MSIIEARGLAKSYGRVAALAGFDLTLAPGQILGLIGPNGCGKTTAIKTLLGFCRRRAGELSVLGLDPGRDRPALMRQTAYIADTGILPRWMRIAHLLDCFDGLHPAFSRAAAEAALGEIGLDRRRRVGTLSKGQNVQLHLSLVLAIDAPLLVLDEPTLGLDQIFRQQFYRTLVERVRGGACSILITTHEVREVAHLLTDVAFMGHGRCLLQTPTATIGERFARLRAASDDAATSARRLNPIAEWPGTDGTEFVFDGEPREALTPLGSVDDPDLAELFIAVTQSAGAAHEAGAAERPAAGDATAGGAP